MRPADPIHYAGVPWELGLAEGASRRCAATACERAPADRRRPFKRPARRGQGRILGAESFGFGTAPMIAMGCKFLRICHSTPATGVATQLDVLRRSTSSAPAERVMRIPLLSPKTCGSTWRGFHAPPEDLVGRVDLVRQRDDPGGVIAHRRRPAAERGRLRRRRRAGLPGARNVPRDPGSLAARIAEDTARFAVEHKRGGEFATRCGTPTARWRAPIKRGRAPPMAIAAWRRIHRAALCPAKRWPGASARGTPAACTSCRRRGQRRCRQGNGRRAHRRVSAEGRRPVAATCGHPRQHYQMARPAANSTPPAAWASARGAQFRRARCRGQRRPYCEYTPAASSSCSAAPGINWCR